MSNETTPAIERAAAALSEYVGTHTQDMEAEGVPEMAVREAEVRHALSAALDVEEMAKVISAHRHGSALPWAEDIRTAEVIRAALLGTTS